MIKKYTENFLRALGKPLVNSVFRLGQLTMFIIQAIYNCFTPPFYLKLLFRQIVEIGFYSLPVVALTTVFAGMVIALQTHTGFSSYGAESAISSVVLIAVTRELAPAFSGLMVAGRVGAAMAAELGTMRVTEQIDALSTLSTNPFKYLIAPRVLASVIVVPLLVMVGDVIGIFGGYLVAIYQLDFNSANYINNTVNELEALDIIIGLVKGAVFGLIISLIGCYNGYKSRGGAQGVGEATTNAVVASSILILIFNYIITGMFFTK